MDFSFFNFDVLFIMLGILSGVAAGFFGIGGGLIIVPTFLIMGYEMPYAIGVSFVQMIFATAFGSAINIARKKLDLKIGIWLGIGGFIGAFASGFIVANVPSQILLGAFICLNFFSLKKYIFNTTIQANPNPPIKDETHKKIALVFIGMLTGVFALSLGIGGGLIIAPLLAYYFGLDSKKIVPISLFFIIFAATSGSISMYSQGLLEISASINIAFGAVIGVAIGLFVIEKISLKNHRFALICIYILSILASTYKFVLAF